MIPIILYLAIQSQTITKPYTHQTIPKETNTQIYVPSDIIDEKRLYGEPVEKEILTDPPKKDNNKKLERKFTFVSRNGLGAGSPKEAICY
jgi:hypothetical protein